MLWRLTGRKSPWPRLFLGLAARAIGAHVTATGTPLRRDVFFVANHLSWIDILALGGATGTAFVSKDDVGSVPGIGWLAAQNNTVFIARHRRHAVTDHVAALRTALNDHQPMTLFPEGTTGFGDVLLPFKPALFAVMLPPPRDLWVQPVYIDYGAAAADIAWHEPGLGANIMRILLRRGPLPVTLHFLEPFDPRTMADRKALATETRKRIEACLPPMPRGIGAI